MLEVGYAFAEAPYLVALLRSGVELVGVDLAEREVEGMERIVADVRALPLPDASVDQVLLVSTLEHVGADNTGYGLAAEDAPSSRADALRELARVLRPGGRMLVTVPLGEPGDHGWFRLDDVPGWTGPVLFRGVVRRGAGGVRADGGGLAGVARLPGGGRRLRRSRAGRVGRPLHGAFGRAAAQARDAGRHRADRQAPPTDARRAPP